MSDYSSVAPPQNFSQSSAFAAALQRAKQIAAKINPTAGGPPPGDAGRPKRPLEDGSEPEAKKLAGLDYNSSPPGISAAAAQAAAVAARVAAGMSQPPGQMGGLGGGGSGGGGGGGPPGPGGSCSEDIRVPDKMVGLIIGRGGEQITRLQAECGCKIQMAPDSGGASERICSLSGPRDAVLRAREMIMNIVNQRGRSEGMEGSGGMGGGGGGGLGSGGGNPGMGSRDGGGGSSGSVEIMIPGPKVGLIIGKGGETIKQLQEKSGAKMVVIQDGPNQEQVNEKPLRITGDPAKIEYAKQLVYFLIAEMEKQSFSRDGPGGGSGGGGGRGSGGSGRSGNGQRSDDRGSNQEYGGTPDGVEVFVPRAAVGVVIGKGGDMIKKIQMETGCRLQFQQTRDEGPGDRRCYLQGKPQQVDQAREMIEDLIDSVQRRDPNDNRSRGGNPRGNDRGNGGQRGPHNGGGSESNYSGWGGIGGNGGGGNANRYEVSFLVPSGKCGVIIGRGGETIKQINQQSGAHCELDRRVQGNPNEKTFVIRGEHEQVEAAKRIISDKVQMQLNFQITSGGSGMGGPDLGNGGNAGGGGPGNPGPMGPTGYPGLTGPQGYSPQGWGYNPQAWGEQQQQHQQPSGGGQVQINPVTGQPDYSAQWIEYYRSLGMHREAEMIEQQNKVQKGGGQQAATGGQPTPGQNGSGAGAGTPNPSAAATPTQNTQQAGGAQPGQPDYSAQWAEYYRSIGKIKEAEAIESQMKQSGKPSQQPQPTAGATPATVPGPGGAFPNPAGPQGGGPYGGGFPGGVPGFFPTAGGQPNNPSGPFQGYGNYGNYPSNDSN